MSNAWFFEKFELIADLPDAVSRMRELVLELAMTGKLSHLCPSGWKTTTLAKVASLVSGQHLLANEQNTNKCGLPYLTGPSDFGDCSPTPTRWTETQKAIAEPGDILITVKGSGIGKTNHCAERCAISRQLMAIRATQINPDYLHLILMKSLRHFQSAKTGIAIPGISRKDVLELPIPLPLLSEQRRIVAKVEELMGICDRLELEQRERESSQRVLVRSSLQRFSEEASVENLGYLFHRSYTVSPSDLRKTILTLAVQGKLVPQDPAEESAEEFLLRTGLVSEYSITDSIKSSPTGWLWVLFEEVATTTGGVTLGRKLGDKKTILLPYLRVANVKRGEIDLSVIKKIEIPESELDRYKLMAGDLLMTEGGDWDKVGRAAIWRAEIADCLHQNHVFRSRLKSVELKPQWFEIFFNSPTGRRYFENASKQTTNLASINMRQVRGCPIPLPPLSEQRRIIARVEELMSLVDELEEMETQATDRGSSLLDAIVHELAATAG